jgi:hypothetical protein
MTAMANTKGSMTGKGIRRNINKARRKKAFAKGQKMKGLGKRYFNPYIHPLLRDLFDKGWNTPPRVPINPTGRRSW